MIAALVGFYIFYIMVVILYSIGFGGMVYVIADIYYKNKDKELNKKKDK